ncbi:MAG: hypothetical protein ACYSUM_03555 [Planctomycetota bacterium]|jgi:hypothetical protein
MPKPTLLVFCLLCLVPPIARAEEPTPAPPPAAAGDAVTAQVPKWSPFVLRISSLERVDAVAKQVIPVLKSFGFEQQVAPIEMLGASGFLFQMSGLDAALVDQSKPIYVALAADEAPHLILHPAAGASWEGVKELQHDMAAELRGGAIVCTRRRVDLAGDGPNTRDAETRGTPTAIALEGDVVVHVYLGDLVEGHKERIEQKAAEAVMQAGANPMLPDAAKALMLPVVSGVKDAIFSLESFEYAVTLKADRIESEGLLRAKPDSNLRALFQRAGAPGRTDVLMGYLPKDGILYSDSVVESSWPGKELATVVDQAVGEGTGQALSSLLGASAMFADQLTGRSATAVSMGGMMMGVNVCSIAEIKEGADLNAIIEKLDLTASNEALKKVGIPLSSTIQKSIATHGETTLHRISQQSENPMLAMQLAMMQTYLAVEGSYLVTVSSPTAEDDIRGLLDKVRTGKPDEQHPHSQAMARLGRAHNVGFTVNAGALKPMGMMLGMFMPVPGIQDVVNNLPDELYFSTAVTFSGGDIHWRGDWPSREIAKMAQAIHAAEAERQKELEDPEEEEDFD